MKQNKQAQTVLIRDPRTVAIINARAQKENRSASNAASTIILESSAKRTNKNPGQAAFLGNVIVKSQGNLSSAETG